MKKQIYLTIILSIFYFPLISQAQGNYEDVVYLKNGSIIHGIIIEQIPNQSVKIETREGSIFFFKIDEIEKIAKEPKASGKHSRYVIFVTMKNGDRLKGRLAFRTTDSLRLVNAWNSQTIQVSGIKSIRIRSRKAIGLGFGLGAAAGAIIGLAIGYSSSVSSHCSYGLFLCGFEQPDDIMSGAVIGAVTGSLLGGAVGAGSGKQFQIEGNQSQFDLFANDLRFRIAD